MVKIETIKCVSNKRKNIDKDLNEIEKGIKDFFEGIGFVLLNEEEILKFKEM